MGARHIHGAEIRTQTKHPYTFSPAVVGKRRDGSGDDHQAECHEDETRKLHEMWAKPRDRDKKRRGTEMRGSLNAWLAKPGHGCEPESDTWTATQCQPLSSSLCSEKTTSEKTCTCGYYKDLLKKKT